MTKILEKPTCAKPKCNNSAFCMYAGLLICGECLVDITEKETKRKKELFLHG